jgi:hypothetical protein
LPQQSAEAVKKAAEDGKEEQKYQIGTLHYINIFIVQNNVTA